MAEGHYNSCPESFYKSREVCGFGKHGSRADGSRLSTSVSMEHIELGLFPPTVDLSFRDY